LESKVDLSRGDDGKVHNDNAVLENGKDGVNVPAS